MADEPTGQWREPTPVSSDDEGSWSLDGSPSYEEEVLTLRPEKKCHAEEEDDPTYSPMMGLQHELLAPQHETM
jgi:hypothetical protein